MKKTAPVWDIVHDGPVIGVDEVGVGCLAGPLLACACTRGVPGPIPTGINDSKKLTPQQRRAAMQTICRHFHWAVCFVPVEYVDLWGVHPARLRAMKAATERLLQTHDPVGGLVVVDGPDRIDIDRPHVPVPGGDGKVLEVGCASIVAKVLRDGYMTALSLWHPKYGWDRNAGYGTPQHIEAIRQHGLTVHHRSYARKFSI